MPEADNTSHLDTIVDFVRNVTAIQPPTDTDSPGQGEGVFVGDQVDRITYHDFALYETVFDPWAMRDPRPSDDTGSAPPPDEIAPPPPEYLPNDLPELEDVSTAVKATISYFLDTEVREALETGTSFDPAPIIRLLHRFRLACYTEMVRHYLPGQVNLRIDQMLMFFIENFIPL